MRVYFSIPFLMPRYTIKPVRNMNTICQTMGMPPLVWKSLNIPESWSGDLPLKPLLMAWYRYSRVHPAMVL